MGGGAQYDVWSRDVWVVEPKIMCRVGMYG